MNFRYYLCTKMLRFPKSTKWQIVWKVSCTKNKKPGRWGTYRKINRIKDTEYKWETSEKDELFVPVNIKIYISLKLFTITKVDSTSHMQVYKNKKRQILGVLLLLFIIITRIMYCNNDIYDIKYN